TVETSFKERRIFAPSSLLLGHGRRMARLERRECAAHARDPGEASKEPPAGRCFKRIRVALPVQPRTNARSLRLAAGRKRNRPLFSRWAILSHGWRPRWPWLGPRLER